MENLTIVARRVRKSILDMAYNARDSHIGCALSSVDVLVALYFGVMKIDPTKPKDPWRDRFILSKGHIASGLYAVLSIRGFFQIEDLSSFAKDGSSIPSHVAQDAVLGVETSGGSGGHGLSLGVGMALAAQIDNAPYHVFVLTGDGELQEGSIWEAAMFASSRNLTNLTLIVDRNMFQTWGKVDDVVALEPLVERFKAFGWNVDEIDGHDIQNLIKVISATGDKPHVVIARTIKGKGVSFMEGTGDWHNGVLTEEQYKNALEEVA